ncbi:MAG: hypothetical protein K6F21_07225 [Bacteroidales bacterium]|nr:hypothetical protein [Bacteroidales bacterium]
MKTKYIRLVLLLCCLAGCKEESVLPEISGGEVRLSVSLEEDPLSKSAVIPDENLLSDINVWMYSSSGVLRESHYIDNLDIHGSGSFSFGTDAGLNSRLVLIGNAGRQLEAPQDWLQELSIPMPRPQSGDGRILFVGEGRMSAASNGFASSLNLYRGMARIGLRVQLSNTLSRAGAQLGRDVRVVSARLCNSPQCVSLLPSSACNSLRHFKADPQTPLAAGDYLDAGDIARLNAGGTVYLYSLPNYCDIPYSAAPSGSTDLCTYLELLFESDSLAASGPGNTLCRFYANDGERIGLLGGTSYLCRVIFSNESSDNYWRKEDYRFAQPGTLVAGTRNNISLLAGNLNPDSLSFSLSSTPGVLSDGVFELGNKLLSNGRCSGVELLTRSAGDGRLHLFDAQNRPMGELALHSEYADFHILPISADVCGEPESFEIRGLEDAYERRVSDEVFEELYSVADVYPAGAGGPFSPENFLTVDIPRKQFHVSTLFWTDSGQSYSWENVVDTSFDYRVELRSGTSSNLCVNIVNRLVGSFASDAYYGQVVNTSEVPSPLPAVRALDGCDIVVERRGVSLPDGFDGSWSANGWASWYGGTSAGGGHPADSYMSVLADGVRWNFGREVTRSLYGSAIPVFIGKFNPWCGDPVRVCVGTYASTKYEASGMEYAFRLLETRENGNFSMLIFREHDPWCQISSGSGILGDNLSPEDSYYLGIDNGATRWVENGRNCYLICYYGELDYLFDNEFGPEERDISSASSFANASIWRSESRASPWNKYAATAYGGNGSYNRWVYLYCPYNSTGVYAADASGRVPAKGLVPVHLWSVSEKATFDYQPASDWMQNNRFTPPWR